MCPRPGPRQGQLPSGSYRLRDFPKARTGQYPSQTEISSGGGMLKGLRKRFEPRGERFGAADMLGIGFSRSGGRRSRFGLLVDQLVGEQKPGEQELPRFGQGAEARQRLAALGVEQARGGLADSPLRLRGRRPDRCARRLSCRPSRPLERGLRGSACRVPRPLRARERAIHRRGPEPVGGWSVLGRSAPARARRAPVPNKVPRRPS